MKPLYILPGLLEVDILDWSCTVIEPCPFCGRDLKDSDRPEAIHTERRPDGSKGWIIHCAEVDFGCGVEMRGDTEEEVLMKWNMRC